MTNTIMYEKKEPEMQTLVNKLFQAFDFFNRELWSGLLPSCAITIGERRGAYGVFRPERFFPKDLDAIIENDSPKMHEILMSPLAFKESERDILAVLVHEMVHMYEEEYGVPAKNGYHNRQWVQSMVSVGLQPSSTGEPGGKETGRKIHHYIIEGGLFDNLVDDFIEETDFSVDWFVVQEPTKNKTSRKRTYRCACPQPWYSNLSGRKAICAECEQSFVEDV